AVSFKIMPADENMSLEDIDKSLRQELSKDFVLGKSSIDELAFGIKVLRFIVIMDDQGGLIDSVEERIRKHPEVGEVDVEEVSLIS
ncbi:MAG: elongation factor 1-beta family protein, partial [Thermoplasmatales archaeon]